MRIVVSGGGTGGHLMPVLALCQALRSQTSSNASEIFFVGTGEAAERKLVEAEGLKYYSVPSGKFRRYGRGIVSELTDLKTLRANATDARHFLGGQRAARKLLKELRPDVVFTKGSYVTVPVGLAAAKLRIPLVIHESDTMMGLANRILARKASAIATGFPVKHFAKLRTRADIVFTGSPIRPGILHGIASRANKHFKLDAKLPVILVIGGSLGAQPINHTVWGSLGVLVKHVQIIHQTGTQGIEEATTILNSSRNTDLTRRYHPVDFLTDELADAYQRADIVVSRCGANSLAEIAALHKPAILIPWPGAANDHQSVNAAFFSHHGAARVIEQGRLTPHTLEHEIHSLIQHHTDCEHLATAIGRLAQPDAADKLAQLVLETGVSRA